MKKEIIAIMFIVLLITVVSASSWYFDDKNKGTQQELSYEFLLNFYLEHQNKPIYLTPTTITPKIISKTQCLEKIAKKKCEINGLYFYEVRTHYCGFWTTKLCGYSIKCTKYLGATYVYSGYPDKLSIGLEFTKQERHKCKAYVTIFK